MRLPGILAAALLLLPLIALDGQAHEVRPGYLDIREVGKDVYDLLWKVPAKGDKRLGLYVRLPANCTGTEPYTRFAGGAYIERWRAVCEGGLVERTVSIDGLSTTRTDVLVRLVREDASSQTVRLTPDAPEFTVASVASTWQVVKTYFLLGVEHILLGIDHLLFVLALLFLVGSWLRLVGTVTAFTVAHSLTLAAATLGWLRVPQAPVEAAIALSIVFVATEVLHARQGKHGLAVRQPWVVAFLFGLLHGLGFAGALREIGLPEHAIPLALAFFNIGVEAGQLLFVAAVFLLFWMFRQIRAGLEGGTQGGNTWQLVSSVSTPVAYLIGPLAAFWVFERTYGFWT